MFVSVVMMLYTPGTFGLPVPDYPALQYGVWSGATVTSPSQLFGLAEGNGAATLLIHGFAKRALGLTVCRVVGCSKIQGFTGLEDFQDCCRPRHSQLNPANPEIRQILILTIYESGYA